MVTDRELRTAIHELKRGRAPGRDGLPGELLKELRPGGPAWDMLRNLFDCILKWGCTPPLFRRQMTVWIPKPGKDPSRATGYRPIGLTSVLSKLLERVVVARLKQKLVLSDHQFAFREGRRAEDSIALLANGNARAVQQLQREDLMQREKHTQALEGASCFTTSPRPTTG